MSSANSDQTREILQENLQQIHARIEGACRKAGRSASDVRLVAVTKYTSVEIVTELVGLGQSHLGENRPQQLIERSHQLPEEVSWHLIGQLQRNKVRAALPVANWIHSVDSLRLLQHIDRVSRELQLHPNLLLQVNISGEKSKSGWSPLALQQDWTDITALKNIAIRGLMTMAPETSEEPVLRETFRGLRILRDQLQATSPESDLHELSMGMSGDFEIAVEEGATLIRLGSVVFARCE